jgi:signal transduction histidine kinase/CheY-like chemotaxis protein
MKATRILQRAPASARVSRLFVLELIAAGLVYFVAVKLGLQIGGPARRVSVFWPATGVALALLVLRGRRLWPAIFLGGLLADILNEAPPIASVGTALAATLEGLLGATLLLRVGFQPAMRRLHDVASLFLLAATLSTTLGATLGVGSLCLDGVAPWSQFSTLWSMWWVGDASGALVTAPFIFVWVDQARREWRFDRLSEAMLLLFAMLALSLAVFVDHGTSVPYPVHYLIFPAVIWTALRLGQHATASLVFGAMSVTVVATVAGRGPFVRPSVDESVLQVTLFMAVVAVTGLFLGAATAERNRAERRRSADYARLRLSEERLARQAEELAAADRRKDEFLAVLGHELRNPLAPLQNGLELLSRAGSDPAVLAKTRGLMERQVRHLVRLVDDLLDVARIRSGKIVLALERVDIAVLIGSAVEIARPMIDARRHQLEVHIASPTPWVDADRTRLPQLLANLLNNSAKYTEEGGRITLSAEQTGDTVQVRVRDSGIGMTPEALATVFELFAQVAGPAHAVQGGLGVGLSLARSIAELHGGTLTAYSQGPGTGSEFILRLPAARPPAAPDHSGNPHATTVPRRRILVVDDNVDAAESLALILGYGGHEIRTAHGGRDAIRIAQEMRPDVMILDLGMPDMDGYAVARVIRSDPHLAHTRLIALSGYGQPEDLRRTATAGFDAHLIKPVEQAALERVLS